MATKLDELFLYLFKSKNTNVPLKCEIDLKICQLKCLTDEKDTDKDDTFYLNKVSRCQLKNIKCEEVLMKSKANRSHCEIIYEKCQGLPHEKCHEEFIKCQN